MVEKLTASIEGDIPRWMRVHAAVILTICLVFYLVYQHADIGTTGGASLVWLSGHIRDFYDYCRQVIGPHNYLPITTLMFAVWNAPLYFLGVLDAPRLFTTAWPLLWFKVLPTVFVFAGVPLMMRIAAALGMTKRQGLELGLLWFTSPLVLYSAFVFGQYDILMTFFLMLALLAYLEDRLLAFALLAGVAFSLKYFAAFAFAPMVLLAEKRFWRVVRLVALFVVVPAIQALPYWSSPAFKEGVLGFQAAARPFMPMALGSVGINLCLAAWAGLCVFAFFTDPASKEERDRKAIHFATAAMCFAFTFMLWHPQWLMGLTPWLAITAYTHRHSARFAMLDVLVAIAFLGFNANYTYYQNATELNLAEAGVLASWLKGRSHLTLSTFLPGNMWLYYSFFVALVLPYAWLGREWVPNVAIVPLDSYRSSFLARAYVMLAIIGAGTVIAYAL